MVTTAPVIVHDAVRRRSISYKVFLWSIPLITWVLLIAVFWLTPRQNMIELISSNNPALMQNVQDYLETEKCPFTVDGNAILILPGEKARILRGLSKQEWFDPAAGWDRGKETQYSQTGPGASSKLAWQTEE